MYKNKNTQETLDNFPITHSFYTGISPPNLQIQNRLSLNMNIVSFLELFSRREIIIILLMLAAVSWEKRKKQVKRASTLKDGPAETSF